MSDGVIAPGYTPQALEILGRKRGGSYNIIQIDPNYVPAPIERKQVFGVTFEQFKKGLSRPDKDNAIDLYISENQHEALEEGVWQTLFTEKPDEFPLEERRDWLKGMTGVSLASDAYFPFGDNIERAHESGVAYIAQPGGSVRDDNVIEVCYKYGIAMAFTGARLFHH